MRPAAHLPSHRYEFRCPVLCTLLCCRLQGKAQNRRVVALGGRLQRLDLTAGRARTPPFKATRDITTLSLSPRGDCTLTADALARPALVALPAGRVAARLSLHPPSVTGAAISHSGQIFAFASRRGVARPSHHYTGLRCFRSCSLIH